MHSHLTDGMDTQAVEDFDRQLGADPALIARVGAPSRGADALMALMGGKPPTKKSNGTGR